MSFYEFRVIDFILYLVIVFSVPAWIFYTLLKIFFAYVKAWGKFRGRGIQSTWFAWYHGCVSINVVCNIIFLQNLQNSFIVFIPHKEREKEIVQGCRVVGQSKEMKVIQYLNNIDYMAIRLPISRREDEKVFPLGTLDRQSTGGKSMNEIKLNRIKNNTILHTKYYRSIILFNILFNTEVF